MASGGSVEYPSASPKPCLQLVSCIEYRVQIAKAKGHVASFWQPGFPPWNQETDYCYPRLVVDRRVVRPCEFPVALPLQPTLVGKVTGWFGNNSQALWENSRSQGRQC